MTNTFHNHEITELSFDRFRMEKKRSQYSNPILFISHSNFIVNTSNSISLFYFLPVCNIFCFLSLNPVPSVGASSISMSTTSVLVYIVCYKRRSLFYRWAFYFYSFNTFVILDSMKHSYFFSWVFCGFNLKRLFDALLDLTAMWGGL